MKLVFSKCFLEQLLEEMVSLLLRLTELSWLMMLVMILVWYYSDNRELEGHVLLEIHRIRVTTARISCCGS